MYSYTKRSICPFETILPMNELIKLQMHVFFAICMCKYCNKHDIPLSLNFRKWLHKAVFQHWPNKSLWFIGIHLFSLCRRWWLQKNKTIFTLCCQNSFLLCCFLHKKGCTPYIFRTKSHICIKSIRWYSCPISISFIAKNVNRPRFTVLWNNSFFNTD